MFVYVQKGSRAKAVVLGIVTLATAWALLAYPVAAANGVRRGLSVCGTVMLPSLFPFLVLGGFLVRSGIGDRIGRRLQWLTRVLFRLPGCAATAVFVGLIGGYPAGAAATAELVRSGRISKQDGKRMLLFCVGGGPAFVVSAVGVGLIGSAAHGWMLLAIQWSVSLFIGIVSRFAAPAVRQSDTVAVPPLSVAAALTASVQAACRALIGMCGFVIAASAALFVTDAVGLPDFLFFPLSCLLEVGCGCVAAVGARTAAPFFLGFALGFGGLSVHGQIAACAGDLLDRRFVAVRLMHGMASGLLAWWLWRYIPIPAAVFAAGNGATVLPSAASSWVGAAALLTLGVVYLLSLCRRGESEVK